MERRRVTRRAVTSIVAIVALALFLLIASEPVDGAIHLLKDEEFAATTSKGTWFVFFGASWCPHCQHLTPLWEKLTDKLGPELKKNDFHIAKVECTENDGLCKRHNVKSYPTLILFAEGQRIDTHEGSKTFEELKSYAQSHVKKAPSVPLLSTVAKRLAAAHSSAHPKSSVPPNPNGRVVSLTQATFDTSLGLSESEGDDEVSSGPWFVEFFAPWCGHCQKLAPIWDEVADKLRGKVGVGKVDCTVEKTLASRFKIRGYPTLIFLERGLPVEYNGPRTRDALVEFAESGTRPAILPIDQKKLEEATSKDEVVFLLAFDPEKIADEALYPYLYSASALRSTNRFFASGDPSILPSHAVSSSDHSQGVVFVLRDNGATIIRFNGDIADASALPEWINQHRKPVLPLIDQSNANEVLAGQDGKLGAVLLDDLRRPNRAEVEKEVREAARAYASAQSAHDGKREVNWGVLDAISWAKYVERQFGVKKGDLPKFVIVDAELDQFYDSDANGKLIDLKSGAIEEAVRKAAAGELPGRSTENFFVRPLKRVGRALNRAALWLNGKWPYIFAALLVPFAYVFYLLWKEHGALTEAEEAGARKPVQNKGD
ncbi:thioredoxin-domain-containing protein [Gonapodya prolifera JEL478]|uniref:Thioredoxin-domain-containing protein n=1 Tax=Gonapodya prolifera (strain JEL478) TaxID=1344416 RepID=A0A139A1Q7_GONPJ|nr:thioredoxin-domain-containing protein [Gonapodya prolifera JEL478]|eukprot:KXS10568.1 thioredoxin-domain-containing protein [Gonapodya prolifera JEL478]